MQAELAQIRKEPSSTTKQLSDMIIKMEEKVKYSLPQAASTTKVLLLQHMHYLYVHHFTGIICSYNQHNKMVAGLI